MEELAEKPKPGMAATGVLLKCYRERANLAPTEAANFLQIDEESLRDIEEGKKRIPQDAICFNGLRNFSGVSDEEIKLLLMTSGAKSEIYPQVLPNYELLTMDDGERIAVRQEPDSTDQEKEAIRGLMRWSHYEFKYGKRMTGMLEWIEEFGIQAR